MNLEQLISELDKQVVGRTDLPVNTIQFDSRKVQKDDVFVAIAGTQTDGHQYIEQAIAAGATAVVYERGEPGVEDITWIKVNNSARALGLMAHEYFERPSHNLKLVGVTGTNGKTSVVTMLHQLMEAMSFPAGLISTVQNRIGNQVIESTHTTPDALSINYLLAQMVEAGCEYCFMEVSSHAIHQERIAGLEYAGAVFTNISHDHLDYHKTFAAYINAKKALFDQMPFDSFALYNKDDRNGRVMVQNFSGSAFSFALKSPADFKVKILEHDFEGMQLEVNGSQAWFPVCGTFNAYNLAAVYGVAMLLELDHDDVVTGMSSIRGALGRFEIIPGPDKIKAIVDYAHTPDALKKVLETINSIRTRNESLITVVGCGGNRDKEKRPVMGEIASSMSSRVIFTSDNPRDEEPEEIINDMKAGVKPVDTKKVLKVTRREEAIQVAVSLASPGDIILIAGKGHETYQEVNGERKPFDDHEVVNKYLKMKE
jgi:UDP-N-acetylmuramoyl-L-alanyl-D-glutamate--2,6-diaminopimelate ligase